MSGVWIRGLDGTTFIPAEEITDLDILGTALVARVASLGIVVLAEGTHNELALAAPGLISGIADLGDGDYTVEAVRREGDRLGWQAVADDGSGGSAWGAEPDSGGASDGGGSSDGVGGWGSAWGRSETPRQEKW